MTLFNVSVTDAIVMTTIGSRAEASSVNSTVRVVWMSKWWRGIEFSLSNGYHSHSSLIITEWKFGVLFTHSPRVFHHMIDSANSAMTISSRDWNIIVMVSQVTIFLMPISSATSTPVISKSQTYHFMMNHIAHTWCARNQLPSRPGIEYLFPATQSSCDWWIGWLFTSRTTASRHAGSNSWQISLYTVLNTELQ